MVININQRKLSIVSKYDISSSSGSFYARKKILSFFDRVQLFDEDEELVARIQSYLYLFFDKYDFILSHGRVFRFRCEKFWKGVFSCKGDGVEYRLYRHKGRRYSIFRDGKQIATITKGMVAVFEGDNYLINADHDADIVVLICLGLIVGVSGNEDKEEGVTFTIDFGNIGPEEKTFDRNWSPTSRLSTPL